MSNVEPTTQPVEQGGRRWSEPVRLGEILAGVLREIAPRVSEVASQGRTQVIAQTLRRKAG